MAESRSIQVKVPPKTHERLIEFARKEGNISASGKPVVAQTVYKMIRFFLAAESDPEWEKRREKSGGNTFGMVDSAVKEHLDKPEKIKY